MHPAARHFRQQQKHRRFEGTSCNSIPIPPSFPNVSFFVQNRNRAYCLVFFLLACVLLGCGDGRPRRVPVSGQVLIDGQPLPGGNQATIQVVPRDARPAFGKIDNDGHFTLTTFDTNDGCVTGTHRVAVVYSVPIGNRGVRWLVPKQYSDPSTSELDVTIEGETNDLTIELTKAVGGPVDEFFE